MMGPSADLRDVCRHLNVSRETSEKLQIYSNLLKKWNDSINLVSRSTLDNSAVRHFADSAQIWQYRNEFKTWCDIGSGAGFPGMVTAIIANEEQDGTFHLVESDARKCAFLRNVSRETSVPVTVHTQRIEDAKSVQADIVSARALAPLSDLLSYASPLLKPGGICLYLKGQNCDHEIEVARKFWTFEDQRMASVTDPNGTVLKIKDIARVE